jgi:hypothetical protein
MGVRLYDPSTGRFQSVDSVIGGNATAYDYCAGDPVNCSDLSGRWMTVGLNDRGPRVTPRSPMPSAYSGPISSKPFEKLADYAGPKGASQPSAAPAPSRPVPPERNPFTPGSGGGSSVGQVPNPLPGTSIGPAQGGFLPGGVKETTTCFTAYSLVCYTTHDDLRDAARETPLAHPALASACTWWGGWGLFALPVAPSVGIGTGMVCGAQGIGEEILD